MYAPEQVDTDEKKKHHFMNSLSTKLQERLALNADWTFLELMSNAIIVDDAICDHWESKKKKYLTAPSGSASHKYRMVCVLHITTNHSSSSISWLPIHRRIRISCLKLWHPHRLCCAHHHRREV
jgi:hypothetical protein